MLVQRPCVSSLVVPTSAAARWSPPPLWLLHLQVQVREMVAWIYLTRAQATLCKVSKGCLGSSGKIVAGYVERTTGHIIMRIMCSARHAACSRPGAALRNRNGRHGDHCNDHGLRRFAMYTAAWQPQARMHACAHAPACRASAATAAAAAWAGLLLPP